MYGHGVDCLRVITCFMCLLVVEVGRSEASVGDLELISISKCAGSAWHALHLLSPRYRLCWL